MPQPFSPIHFVFCFGQGHNKAKKKELKKRKPKADSDNSWTVYAFWGADVTFGGSKREFFEPAPSASPILRLLLKKQNQKKENKTVFGAGRKEKAKHLFQLEQLNEIFERV